MKVFPKFFLAILVYFASAQTKSHNAGEQTAFGLGTDGPVVVHPTVLSDAELAALANDPMMREELNQDPPIASLTREGLEVSVVHLHGPHERDLIVIGSGAPFMGANVGPFWVIRDLPTGPQVVLSVIALSLEVTKTSSKGFSNIEAFVVTATTDFRFDGKKYIPHRQYSRPLGKV